MPLIVLLLLVWFSGCCILTGMFKVLVHRKGRPVFDWDRVEDYTIEFLFCMFWPIALPIFLLVYAGCQLGGAIATKLGWS